jgi:O-methyltransferase domain
LRYLASNGVFAQTEEGYFDHTPLSLCLRGDAEGSFRPAALLFHRLSPAWSGLLHSALTGEPGFNKVFGQPVFEYVARHPEMGPIFDAGMTAIHGHETAAMLAACDFSGVKVLADIGGGNGSLLSVVLGEYPNLKGVLFDLGHVAERARQRIAEGGLADRCQVLEGNFFERVPEGADAYLLRHVIHDWTDEQSLQILRNCRKAIPDDGRLLVVECVVPAGNEPSLAKAFDITMLTFPGGIERTAGEFRSLFEQAGFELTSITPTKAMISVVEGKPK